ncbi:MAG: aminotransferase class IV, partial [Anaerolineae bacterium]|nr:aminotransferase class IV [Anaerolineae bacterium]
MGKILVYQLSGDELHQLPIEADSLDEATRSTGHGVYAVFLVYEGLYAVHPDDHLDRMRSSAALLGQPFPRSNTWLREACRRAVSASGIAAPRIRITVPHDNPECAIIAVEPFTPPPAHFYSEGVAVGLVQHARVFARAKDSRFTESRAELFRDQPTDVYEVMLYNIAGEILEGASSNFYGIMDGVLCTADEGVLAGIARSMLLKAATQVLTVRLKPISITDLPYLSEAMMTSSTRGVLPVIRVGSILIGDTHP